MSTIGLTLAIEDKFEDLKFTKPIVLVNSDKVAKSRLVLSCMEELLANDYTGNFAKELDSDALRSDNARLTFEHGCIIGYNSSVKKEGVIPKIHAIRMSKDGILRQFIINNGEPATWLGNRSTVTTVESVKCGAFFNHVLGAEVALPNLSFDFLSDGSISEASQKAIYTLISACMCTQDNYERIVMLELGSAVSQMYYERLLGVLTNIQHNLLVICNITGCTLKQTADMDYINV